MNCRVLKYVFLFVLLVTVEPCFSMQISPDSTLKTVETTQKTKMIRLWGEFYNESTSFQSNKNNLIASSHVRQGLRIHAIPQVPIEIYFTLRYGRDLHRDYWNNRFETGLGLRIRFLKKVFLAVYSEFIRGYYLQIPENYPQPYNKKFSDFRSGLIFWYGWDKPITTSRFVQIPMHSWGELYSDMSYFRSQADNIVAYTHARVGLRVFRIWKSVLDVFGMACLLKDINKDFWNNKIEYGPGIWFRPILSLTLKMYVEWPQGRYFGIEGRDPNPYPKKYQDRRMGIILWLGW